MILAPLAQGKIDLATQYPEDLLEFHPQLADDLLALTHVRLGFLAHETLPGAADREAFIIQKAADLTDDQNVLALIVTPVAAPLDGLKLWELLFPVTQHVRLDRTKFTYLSDSEIAFPWDWR